MKKTIYKGIFGVFIFVFALLTVSTLTMKNVYAVYDAKKCKAAQKELKQTGVLLDRYGITIDYNDNTDTYVVTMKGNPKDKNGKEKFKLTKIRFYDPEYNVTQETASSALGENDYGIVESVDDNGKIKTSSSVKMVFGGREYNEGAVESLHERGIISSTFDIVDQDFNHAGVGVNSVILSKGVKDHNITIKRKALYNDAGDTRMGIALTFTPIDIKVPELEPCGDNTTFQMTIGVGVEIYDDIDPTVYDSGIDTTNIKFSGIDCNNYASKFKEDSFEYKFCNDLDNATKAGVVNTKGTTKTVNGKKLSYTDKYNPTKAFQCKEEDIVGPTDVSTMKDYYVNKKYLYGESSETIDVGKYVYHIDGTDKNKQEEKITCKKTCREVVTVEYGPPVAQTAGFCFEYKVKVTSRVDCSGELSTKEPKKYAVCTPTPECDHGSRHIITNQGGPNEQFDSCVKSCDGGKYTDKCVNKCYKQVYGKSAKKTSGTDTIYASQLNNTSTAMLEQVGSKTSDTYLKDLKEQINQLKNNGSDASKKELKKLDQLYTYTCANKNCTKWNINWNVQSYSRYTYNNGHKEPYNQSNFSSPYTVDRGANKTEGTDAYWYQVNNWGLTTSAYNGYYSVSGGQGIPVIKNCNLNWCVWKPNTKGICASDDYAHYINDPNVYDSSVRQYLGLSGSDAANSITKDRDANIKAYNKAKEACQAVASCSTSSAEFAISVKYKDSKGKDVYEYFPFTPTNSKDTKATIKPGDYPNIACSQQKKNPNSKECSKGERSSIILDYAGCYNCAGSTTKKMYMTEWSFPGYYEDRKYGDRYYDGSYSCDTKYKYVANKWCIPGKDKMQDANQYWYNYYQDAAHKGDDSYSFNNTKYTNSIKDCKTSSTTYSKEVDWNIFANTKNFGYLDWEISMKCFYASNRNYKSSTTNKVCKDENCKGDKCDKNGYVTRSTDLSNMFPDDSGKKPTSDKVTMDTPGFNWTEYATMENKNLDKNGKYTQFALESNPPALIEWVQKQGSSIYSNENVDYAVTLTKADINAIRKELNGKDKYTSWPGSVVNNNVYNYTSDLIRKTLSNSVYPNPVALKCNNIAAHTPGASYSAECQVFTEGGK